MCSVCFRENLKDEPKFRYFIFVKIEKKESMKFHCCLNIVASKEKVFLPKCSCVTGWYLVNKRVNIFL